LASRIAGRDRSPQFLQFGFKKMVGDDQRLDMKIIVKELAAEIFVLPPSNAARTSHNAVLLCMCDDRRLTKKPRAVLL